MGKLNTTPSCPTCSKLLDGYTAVESEELKPKAGDVTICAYCRNVLEFTDDMKLKHASVETIAEMTLEISRAQRINFVVVSILNLI